MLPSASCGLRQQPLNRLRPVRLIALRFEVAKQAALVAGNELFQYPCSRHPRQVGSAGRRSQRQAEADQIMRGISDHGLIKISDLHPNVALRIGQGTKIANVTVAANPDGWTIRELAAATAVEPFVKLDGASAHIGMRGL